MHLRDRVLELAKERGITSIAALERMAGLGNGTITKWNESIPSVDKLIAISNVLGVSVGYILEEDTQDNDVADRDRLRDELFHKSEYCGLMDMASKCTPEEIRTLMEMIKTWKKMS